jgi:hypothetical protein
VTDDAADWMELRAALFVAASDADLILPRALLLRLFDAMVAELVDTGCVLVEAGCASLDAGDEEVET